MAGPSARMLTLLSLLQSRRDWPGAVLAERLDVTSRTVRRDVDRLRELGYRISAAKGPDGGYRLEAGSELPPLLFDDEQAVAVAVALRNVPASGVEVEEAAQRALATVRQVMPSRLRHRVDDVRFTGTRSPVRVHPDVLDAVGDAVRHQVTLRFFYGDGDDTPRRAEPHGLVARFGRWYLVGWDLDREDWRTYRLDRLTPRTPTGPRFARRPVPTGDVGAFVAARAKGSSDQDGWPCVGEVEIDLPVRELSPWVDDGSLEALPDGSTRMITGSWSWPALLSSVLRFDADFRIIGPPAFRDSADALAGRLGRA